MTIAAIIVAAGRGTRAGGTLPKQWQSLGRAMVVEHAIAALRPFAVRIVVVVHPDDADIAKTLSGVQIVRGGATRNASVRAALEALAGTDTTRALIHDAARPFVSASVIRRVLSALEAAPGAAPALPVTDALWRGEAGRVAGTTDRTGLYRAQTPQGFDFAAILAAHRAHQGDAVDDVAVARGAGLDVAIVEGDETNIKITHPDDFARAERMIGNQGLDVRVGNGFDVHAFTAGNAVTLCGVSLAHDRALLGHSDADVGMHALTDAIYGALAEGDIGRHFPPSDPQWKGADSAVFLRHAADRITARGYRLTQADVTLICERPKIGPHAEAMRGVLAGLLGVETDRVSVKATTSERLGFTGREEGIAALATATLVGQP